MSITIKNNQINQTEISEDDNLQPEQTLQTEQPQVKSITIKEINFQKFFEVCVGEKNFNTIVASCIDGIVDMKFSTPYIGKHHYIRIRINSDNIVILLTIQFNSNIFEKRNISQEEALQHIQTTIKI